MPDLKILLTADLNEVQTVANINSAIERIQKKIIKLRLEVDTSSLKNADVMLKGLGSKMADQQKKIKRVVDQTSNLSGDGFKDFEKRVKQIDTMIEKTGRQSKASYVTDDKGKLKSATIEYTDAAGKMIRERMKWETFTNKVVTGKDSITGKKKFDYVQQNVFKTVGQTYVENTKQLRQQTAKIFADAQKAATTATSSTKPYGANSRNQDNGQSIANAYKRVTETIKSANAVDRELTGEEMKRIQARMDRIKQLENRYKELEKVRAKEAAKGTKLADVPASAFNGKYSEQKIKDLIASQYKDGKNNTIDRSNVSFTKDINTATGRLIEYNAKVKQSDGTTKVFKGSVTQATGALQQLGNGLNNTANRNLDFMSKFKIALQSIPIWMAGMTAFYQTLHFFTDGVKYVNELNRSLTELSITLMKSQAEVAHYAQDFHDLGMQMSVSTQEIARGAVEFARQGKTGTDMIESMKDATVYAKISNLDFVTSANILTATVNSMGVSASHATDIFSYMGDATATGADEIGRAMQKVGGSAGALNIPFEKVASWVAVVSSRTRESAETIGNSIKSIIARVQSLKERGFDSENPDGVDYNQVTKALDAVGIKAVEANGDFRNFGSVMDDLGKKWDSLSGKQKSYIATTVAGSYQQARFLNIMEGYEDSVDLYEKSLTKAGIAQDKFNLYQQGTEAQLTKMKNAWTGIFQSTFQTDGINSAIAMLTGLGTTIDSVVKHMGAFPVIMNVAAIAVMALSSTFRKSLGTMSAGLIPFVSGLNAKIAAVKLEMVGMTGAAYAGRAGMVALATAAKGLLVSIAPLAIITGITMGLQKLTESYYATKQAAAEKVAEESKIVASVTEHREVLDNLLKSYKELNQEKENGTLDAEGEEKYRDVIQQISDIMPSLVERIDSKGEAHLKNAEAIDREIASAKQLADLDGQLKLENSDKSIQDYIDKYKKAQELIADTAMNQFFMNPVKDYDAPEGTEDFKRRIENEREMLTVQREVAAKANDARNEINSVISTAAKFASLTIDDKLKNSLNEVVESMDFSKIDGEKIGSTVRSIVKSLASIQKDGVEKSSVAIAELQSALDSLGVGNQAANLYNSFSTTTEKVVEAKAEVMTYKAAMESLNSSYENTSSTLEILNGLLEDNANGKKVSAEEVMKLVQKDAALVNMFKIENGIIQLNIDAINKKKTSSINAMNAEMEAKRRALAQDGEILLKKFGLFEQEINGTALVAESYDKVNNMMYEKMYNATSIAEAQYWNEQGNKAKALVTQLDNIKKAAEIAAAAAKTVGTSISPKKEKKEKEPKDPVEEYKTQRTELDRLNEELQRQENLTATYPVNSAKYRDSISKEIVLLGALKNETHKQAEAFRAKEVTLKSQIAAMGDFNSLNDKGREKLNDLRKELEDVQGSIADMSDQWFQAASKIKSGNWNVVQSKLGEINEQLELNAHNTEFSQAKMSAYSEDSKEYRNELNLQIGLMKNRQTVLSKEADYIRQMLKDDKLTVEQKAELTTTLRGLTVEWWNLSASIKSNTDAMKAQRETVADGAIQAIKDAIQAQADAVSKMVEDIGEKLEKAHDDEMDRLEEEQEKYERNINDKIKANKKLSDERSYGQNLSDAEQKRQEILNKITLLSMDNSEEAKTQLKALQKQLVDSNREIDNLKYDHAATLEEEQLQKQIEDSQRKLKIDKEEAEFKIEIWDEYNQKKVRIEEGTYKELKKKLEDFKEDQEKHYDDLLNDEQRFAKLKAAIVAGSVQGAINELGTLKKWFDDNLPAVGEVIQRNMTDKMQEFIDKLDQARSLESTIAAMKANSEAYFSATDADKKALAEANKKYADNIDATQDKNGNWVGKDGKQLYTIDENSIVKAMKENSEKWKTATATEKAKLEAQNKSYGAKIGATYNSATGKWMKNGIPLYHTGGIVNGAGDKQVSLANKLFNAAPNEQVIMALKDELMVPSQNIAKNFIPNLENFVQSLLPKIPTSGSAAGVAGGGNIIIEIGSVVGDEKGADIVTKKIVAGIKKLGGKF